MIAISPRDKMIVRWLRAFFLEALPILTIIILMVIMIVPIGTPSSMHLGGLWPLMGLTYWILTRPRAMRPTLVFFLGLLTDTLLFLPLGLHGFIFVLAQALINKQRRFLIGQGFIVMWAAFGVLSMCVSFILYFMTELILGGGVTFDHLIWSILLSIGLLPLVLILLDRVSVIMDLFDEPV
jgi:rod shape-determining protein MreD